MESNRWKLNIKVVSGLVCIIFPIYFSLFFWTFFLMLFLQKFESKQSFNGHLMITNIFTVIFSFQNILSYKFDGFPFELKTSWTVAITFAVWSGTAKGAQVSFSFFTITLSLRNRSIWFFFSSLLSGELLTFYLKEALYRFSLAYPNCQNHYSWALGPLLSKISVTWTSTVMPLQLIT